ncbi:YveK family protein [Aquihabitans sp. McL0605]|uniref:YveK family protein n=1 Tax=Aquihabitans sp. McL0605 TaxID=3415671 RepID=UPI003CF2A7AE
MELNGLFPIIRRWLAVILVATAMATAVGLLLGASADKTYEAKAEVLVGPLSTDSDTMRASGDLAQTYAQLATSDTVLAGAAKELGVSRGEIKTGVRATANSTTRFLVVRARAHSAKGAADIANAVALQLLSLGKQDPTRPEGQLRVIDPANAPSKPISPRLDLIVPLAALAGLLGSLTLVLLFEFVGDTAESEEKVDALTGVPTLALKRHRGRGDGDRQRDLEPYRMIATHVDLAAPEVRCVLITGVTADDGTDGLARRLAEVWSHRRPSVAALDSSTGEVIMLSGDSRGTVVRQAADPAMDPESVTPDEAIALRDWLAADGGLLVVHGQPATVSAATLVWARVSDVTVLGVRRFQARRSAISEAVVNLQAVDANLAMSVLHERSAPSKRSGRANGRRTPTSERHAADPDDAGAADLDGGVDEPVLQPAGADEPVDVRPEPDPADGELIGASATEERARGGSGSATVARRRAGPATTRSGAQR